MGDEKNEFTRARAVGRATEGAMNNSQAGNPPNKPAGRAAAQPEAKTSAKAPPAQDRWFDTQLSRMYADLAADPLPKDMMALLDKLKKTER
jgi:hypothetical protein